MNKKINFSYLLFVLLSGLSAFSQAPNGTYKQKLSPYDVYFGHEDVYQICYPRSHRTYFNSIILLSISSITLLTGFLVSTKRKNKILNTKNNIIENQNQELLDSIVYAQRIQNALLPTISEHNTHIFFQPKNIVSGDFYWLYSHQQFRYFSVIDCTGHGVPGAFLSMLAHSAINNAIIEQKLTNPHAILCAMNQLVNSALHQQENKHIRDGMEVGVCVLNTETNILQYAGAGIKLLYITNNVLTDVKAAKCTIGADDFQNENKLELHELQLQKGDRIFMNSDGITDQFGHATNKKFSTKRLKQLIENTAAFDFSRQQQTIEKEIIIWKGNTEQTDDMLMMSIEV
jgi:serine phosphatase RsbU (regulator of sigma subunit)